MSIALAPAGQLEMTALGTSALLTVTDPGRLAAAEDVLRTELAEIDRTCSRFRADSEITELHRAGTAATVSPLLAQALDAALRAAELTDGLVDPTVGASVRALGYDGDFAGPGTLDSPAPSGAARPAPGWWRLYWDPTRRELLLPRGVELDLGATAKALAADRAAALAAEMAGCGVMVDLGGDLSTAGTAPEDGWPVAVGDDHQEAAANPGQVVAVHGGGIATSSTVTRAWRRGGRSRHHIVDPRTGDNPPAVWRAVTVAAGSCVDANIASTAAVVLGAEAPRWLTERGLPARLVAPDGRVVRTPGWPASEGGD